MSSSLDGSFVRSIRMPQLTSESVPVDVWFELGKIRFHDPLDPEEICSVTPEEFEERIKALNDQVDRLEEKYGRHSDKRVVYCGRQEFKRFFNDAMEMTAEAKKQVHIGMPLSQLFEAERTRKPIRARPGFESPIFQETQSGLIIPK
jgi:uncharacterized small protein (DUF1192 family)